MKESWRALWAKSDPFHPLWKHLLDAAAVSLALEKPIGGLSGMELALVVGLHDVGKADAGFQQAPTFRAQFPDVSRRMIERGFIETVDSKPARATDRGRHERISASVVRNLADGCDDLHADALGRAITAHHGHWAPNIKPRCAAYIKAQGALLELIKKTLGVEGLSSEKPDDLSAFGMRLAGHVVLCDWIASNEAFFTDGRLEGVEEPAAYFERAKEVAVEMVGKLGLCPDKEDGKPEAVVGAPRPLQQALLDAKLDPGMVVIEAPMGEGKTEAAWILAEQWRAKGYKGMYMALPTQATGDAIFERYGVFLRTLGRLGSVRLVHGMAWLRDDVEPTGGFALGEDAEFAAQWLRPTRRAMLAAHGAGTIDQFLLAGLNARFGFLRLYGLDGRVLVVDEVHAYDAYMTAILCRGLQWCAAMRIPVVLLSATLSAKQRRQLLEAYGAKGADDPGPEAAYPLVTRVGFDGAVSTLAPPADAKRTLTLTPHAGLLGTREDPKADEVARLAADLMGADQCVCVIVNTVRQAQAVYQALDLPDDRKGLFHARFTAGDREMIAKDVIAKFGKLGKESGERPKRGYVLVATQVVEQSLDVDFDEMVSEIAPVDLLLQRSGRLHRHPDLNGERGVPNLHVLLPGGDHRFGGTEKVYDRYVLLRTLALVASGRTVELPKDFRPLIEAVYGDGPIPGRIVGAEDLENALRKWKEGLKEMQDTAGPILLNEPMMESFSPVGDDETGDDSDDGNGWRAKTRLGANDRTCLFVRTRDLEWAKRGTMPRDRVKALYRETVRVPSYVRLDAPAEGFEPAAVAEGQLRGLTLIPYVETKEWKSVGQDLCYDEALGLVVSKA